MRAYRYPAADVGDGRLLIFLPGIDDVAEDFARRGFVAAVHRRCPGMDMIAADARFTYYARRNLVRRLHEDIVAPALVEGYRELWLAGISMGALGSFLYTNQYPKQVAGLLWVAPYLGGHGVADEVAEAGGLAEWRPGESRVAGYQHEYWSWLKGYARAEVKRPPLYLAYGEEDRYARADRLLADVLPENRVFTVPGGHQWETWQRLWTKVLKGWPPSAASPDGVG